MIRNFFTIAKQCSRPPIYRFQPSLHFLRQASFASGSDATRYAELRHISRILQTPYFRFNNEINVGGDVRLIDGANKLIGIYSISDAKKKCQQLNLDIVLINSNARPPICKAYNYKEDLYKKFVKDVLEKDLSKATKTRQQAGQSKTVKLGPKMNRADLNTKVELAREMAKKVRNVRIYMNVSEENEEAGRNIIFTFRDLAREFLKPKGEIEERDIEEEEEDYKGGKKEGSGDEGDEKVLSQEFQSLLSAAPKELRAMTEGEITEMIQSYIQREVQRKSMTGDMQYLVDTEDPDLKAVLDEVEDDEDIEMFRFKSDIANLQAEEEIEQDPEFDDLISDLKLEGDAQTRAKIDEEVEELRQKYGKSTNEALYDSILDQQDAKVRAVERLTTFKALYEKRKFYKKR